MLRGVDLEDGLRVIDNLNVEALMLIGITRSVEIFSLVSSTLGPPR